MSAFLTEPELFPRRISGEAWGTRSVSIELAEERFSIDGLSDGQMRSLEERYGSRTAAHGDGVSIRVFRAPVSDFRRIDTRGWEYALDIEWSADAITIAGMHLMARVDLANARAGVWTCVDDVAEFWGALENVLRPLLAARLLANGGLLVHSAAVKGWLFAGASGSGKSTLARMALHAGLPVLSDDLNAIVRGRIVPLPFTGDLTEHDLSTTAVPLEAIFAIEKADRESVRELPVADAVALLVRCAPYVNRDLYRTSLLLDRASEIAASVRRGVLTFRREGQVWPILDSPS